MTIPKEALERFELWLEEAKSSPLREPTAMSLATIDEHQRPDVRIVLLKGLDERGFVFYTNMTSNKGAALKAHPRAALGFFWEPLMKQVRVQGRVEQVSSEEADAYFASRHRLSQLGAWASLQSSVLDKRQTLLERLEMFKARFANQEVPRPSHWTGNRVVPDRIEFWVSGEFRLHNREVFECTDEGWKTSLLFP